MRGRTQVFANLEGSWQASGRRLQGRYEVLNAVGSTLVLLDRYDGTVFTAGRQPEDNVYVSSLSLSQGAQVRVKAVELQLHDENLARALVPLYQMQQEAGLQHIYVSGELILEGESPGIMELQEQWSRFRLPMVQPVEPGHYELQYLTAAGLIGLANTGIESANLVIVATYVSPADGPTATPLPSPAALSTGEP
jgi:hypothetical protein